MSVRPWSSVTDELAVWRDRGLAARVWVRDDDAISPTPALDRLAALARVHDVSIGLAVIPARASAALAAFIAGSGGTLVPMCHGWQHANHGTAAAPSEFGPERPFAEVRTDTEAALAAFSQLFGGTRAVFVPPYNRVRDDLVAVLPEIGFTGLSAVPARAVARAARLATRAPWLPPLKLQQPSGLARHDVEVDLIDWRSKTARADEAVAADLVGALRLRRFGLLAADAPIGLLSHHLDHDAAIWDLMERLLGHLAGQPAVQFTGADALFPANRSLATQTESLHR